MEMKELYSELETLEKNVAHFEQLGEQDEEVVKQRYLRLGNQIEHDMADLVGKSKKSTVKDVEFRERLRKLYFEYRLKKETLEKSRDEMVLQSLAESNDTLEEGGQRLMSARASSASNLDLDLEGKRDVLQGSKKRICLFLFMLVAWIAFFYFTLYTAASSTDDDEVESGNDSTPSPTPEFTNP